MLVTHAATPLSTGQVRVIPVLREVQADLETPVSIYLKLSGQGPSFLLESITGGEQVARYSFIGVQPRKAYILRGQGLSIVANGRTTAVQVPLGANPFDVLRQEMAAFQPESRPDLPRLIGGLVGYLGYDTISYFEPSVGEMATSSSALPQALFLLADTVVAFDHAFGRLLLIANVFVEDENEQAAALAAAERRLDVLENKIQAPLPPDQPEARSPGELPLQANISREEFIQAVEKAKEHIAAGDIFQVVLSQQLRRKTSAAPFDIYRALRGLNPSPYMFYFDFDRLAGDEPLALIGASPEMHVRLKDNIACLRPIAGTRPRGASPEVDLQLENELLNDPKERAEHVMLVDLARNDLGRVCEFGSVTVTELMAVERYSHVMHIVSQVEGRLRAGVDAFELLQATFPAGTVTGAPKIRAMQIIADLETANRGPYAGAVGYFSFDGSMDTCITIRTLAMQGDSICVQAGAGIVADSDPLREYQETFNKARALAVAVEKAEQRGGSGQLL
jgi:anthranilate synthase component 1